MSIPTKQSLYAIADRYNRTASVAGNAVVFNNQFTPLDNNPAGWDTIEIQLKTVQKYFSLDRSFTVPLTFVKDGARIIRDRLYKGKGYAEELYLLILTWDSSTTSPTAGQYILEYKGRIDLSQGVIDDPLRGVTVNTKEAGAVSFLNSNETVVYEIPADDTNPKAIKVLFDGITLFDKYNYKVVEVDIVNASSLNYTSLPLTFIKNEGDSVGVEHGSQSYEPFDVYDNYFPTSSNHFFYTAFAKTVDIDGEVIFKWRSDNNVSGKVVIFYRTSKDAPGAIPTDRILFSQQNLSPNFAYTVPVKKTISLVAGEKLFLAIGLFSAASNHFTVTLLSSAINVSFTSVTQNTTAYALRPLDLWQQLVARLTNGRFKGDSAFLRAHNNIVAIAGESLRSLPDAKFKTTVADFFQSYNAVYNLGIKIVNDVIYLEPKSDLYNDSKAIFDLGEVSDLKIKDANEYIVNTIKTGGPVQDYQNFNTTNGRYEYNDTVLWQMPNVDTKKELNLVSKYRIDPYGQEFIRGALDGKTTTDNKADNEVFMVNISNEKAAITTAHNTATLFTVNENPDLPTILTTYHNAVINNSHPTIKGYAKASTKVGILVDGAQEGYTTSDVNGFWSYNVTSTLSSYAVSNTGTVISSGIHTIGAAYTDSSGVIPTASLSSDISVTIDTTVQSPFLITSPENEQYTFDNQPVIKGTANAGAVVNVSINGNPLASVTADGSCRWEYKINLALSDGPQFLSATYNGVTITSLFHLSFSSLTYPLVTKINGATEAIIYNNLPLIEGVATPNSSFQLFFDFNTDTTNGLTIWPFSPQPITADANGNWQYQVSFAIPDGDHDISATPQNEHVFLTIDGYKLNRAQYSAASGAPFPKPGGVLRTDIAGAPYNIEELTPKRQLLAHGNYLHSLVFQQPEERITFQTADKNKNLSTTLNGVTITEKKDVQVSTLPAPLFLPYVFEFKTKVPMTFAQIMSRLEAGDIQFQFNGVVLYALPIGELTAKPANDEPQTWRLLASPKNSLQTILNLSM